MVRHAARPFVNRPSWDFLHLQGYTPEECADVMECRRETARKQLAAAAHRFGRQTFQAACEPVGLEARHVRVALHSDYRTKKTGDTHGRKEMPDVSIADLRTLADDKNRPVEDYAGEPEPLACRDADRIVLCPIAPAVGMAAVAQYLLDNHQSVVDAEAAKEAARKAAEATRKAA